MWSIRSAIPIPEKYAITIETGANFDLGIGQFRSVLSPIPSRCEPDHEFGSGFSCCMTSYYGFGPRRIDMPPSRMDRCNRDSKMTVFLRRRRNLGVRQDSPDTHGQDYLLGCVLAALFLSVGEKIDGKTSSRAGRKTPRSRKTRNSGASRAPCPRPP
jgi:hypothetical protein